jgi:hypothetical protein
MAAKTGGSQRRSASIVEVRRPASMLVSSRLSAPISSPLDEGSRGETSALLEGATHTTAPNFARHRLSRDHPPKVGRSIVRRSFRSPDAARAAIRADRLDFMEFPARCSRIYTVWVIRSVFGCADQGGEDACCHIGWPNETEHIIAMRDDSGSRRVRL